MRLTVDTNILIRAFVEDDPDQAAKAKSLLSGAALIVIPVPAFCEFAWVLSRSYGVAAADIASAIAALADSETVLTDRPAVEAGIDMVRAGGDFADGAIAMQGVSLGGTVFASFDRKALDLWRKRGGQASDPAALLTASDR